MHQQVWRARDQAIRSLPVSVSGVSLLLTQADDRDSDPEASSYDKTKPPIPPPSTLKLNKCSGGRTVQQQQQQYCLKTQAQIGVSKIILPSLHYH